MIIMRSSIGMTFSIIRLLIFDGIKESSSLLVVFVSNIINSYLPSSICNIHLVNDYYAFKYWDNFFDCYR